MGVLLKFRQRKYAVMGDITQMFHQVQVLLPSDCDALRFLLCFNENMLVDTYEMYIFLTKQILQIVRTGLLGRLL